VVVLLRFALGVGVTQFGWAIMGSTMPAAVFISKFGWDRDQTKLHLSLLGNISILGVMIGSLIGGRLIAEGRRRAILAMTVLIYVACGITMYLSFATLMIGRFVQGFAAGVLNMCCMMSVVESVPSRLCGMFGAATNIGLNSGCLICVLVGLALPSD